MQTQSTDRSVSVRVSAGRHRRYAQAQTKLGPAAPVTYDNKYEIYAGLNYMNFKAGRTCLSA